MNYNPIRSRWVVLALLVTAALAVLCEAAPGTSLAFPRVLWLVPFSLFDAVAIALVAVLLRRIARLRKRDDT